MSPSAAPARTSPLPVRRPPRNVDAAIRAHSTGRDGPKAFVWWYEAIINEMISNPAQELKDIARKLGRTENWIWIVVRSDSFKARYTERCEDHARNLSNSINAKAGEVVMRGFEVLLEKLENPAALPVSTVMDVVDRTLEKLGYGAKANPAVQVNANGAAPVVVISATPDDLKKAQDTIRRLEQGLLSASGAPAQSGPVIEGEIVAEPAQPASE